MIRKTPSTRCARGRTTRIGHRRRLHRPRVHLRRRTRLLLQVRRSGFGYLDYALANQALLGQVTGTRPPGTSTPTSPTSWTTTPPFKEDAQDALYEPNPYRSSDHDPVVVGLELTPSDTQAPVITLKRPSEVLWPPNHKYETIDLTQIIASVSDDVSDLSVSDVVITRVSSDEPENGAGDGNDYGGRHRARVLSDASNSGPKGAGAGTGASIRFTSRCETRRATSVRLCTRSRCPKGAKTARLTAARPTASRAANCKNASNTSERRTS